MAKRKRKNKTYILYVRISEDLRGVLEDIAEEEGEYVSTIARHLLAMAAKDYMSYDDEELAHIIAANLRVYDKALFVVKLMEALGMNEREARWLIPAIEHFLKTGEWRLDKSLEVE